MKNILQTILCCTLLAATFNTQAQFAYVNPVPGSVQNNKQTNIILKNGGLIDAASIANTPFTINGSASGIHQTRIILSDDGKTIVIYPVPQLLPAETVTVTVGEGLRKTNGNIITGTSFQFQTRRDWTAQEQIGLANSMLESKKEEYGGYYDNSSASTRDQCNSVTEITLDFNEPNAFQGDAFYFNFELTPPPVCFAQKVITVNGDSVFTRYDNKLGLDFKINNNGYITYHHSDSLTWHMADSTFTEIKKFQMGNGYLADEHDFQIFPNGRCFMFAYDLIPGYDLTSVPCSGGFGKDSMTVQGGVVQELDANGNVIFEWKSWDHVELDDAMFWIQNQLCSQSNGGLYELTHYNSVELYQDSFILLSSRSMGEIDKISLNTGNIKWRFGGENNQFTFIGTDPDLKLANDGITYYFSGQHDARIIANGNLTLFNNDNNLTNPIQSSAKEYKLDEVNKTATLVWRYNHPLVNGFDVISNAMGNAQRLPNGNTLINWGLISKVDQPYPKVTEVDSLGNIVWELRWISDSVNFASYRVHKYDWQPCNVIDPSSLQTSNVTDATADLSWGDDAKITSYILEYKKCSESVWTDVALDQNTYQLTFLKSGTCYEWRIITICEIFGDSAYSAIQTFNTDFGVDVPISFELLSGFNVYPNPTTAEVTAKFTLAVNSSVEIAITNLLGDVIKQQTFDAIAGTNKVKIDLTTLAAGSYVVQLKAGTQLIRRQLVLN